MSDTTQLKERYIVVKVDGDVVEKFANKPLIPDEIYNRDDITFENISTVDELSNISIDRSNIDNDEIANLLEKHWNIR